MFTSLAKIRSGSTNKTLKFNPSRPGEGVIPTLWAFRTNIIISHIGAEFLLKKMTLPYHSLSLRKSFFLNLRDMGRKWLVDVCFTYPKSNSKIMAIITEKEEVPNLKAGAQKDRQ